MDDRGPAFSVDFRRILLRKTHLVPNTFIDYSFVIWQVRSARVDPHVIVKTAVGVKFSSQKTRVIVRACNTKAPAPSAKIVAVFLSCQIEIFTDRISTDNQHVSIS